MHTIAEAKLLWCPMTRPAEGKHGADGSPDFTCVADACAMWRWAEPAPRQLPGAPVTKSVTNRRGYCGLAGRPEVR